MSLYIPQTSSSPTTLPPLLERLWILLISLPKVLEIGITPLFPLSLDPEDNDNGPFKKVSSDKIQYSALAIDSEIVAKLVTEAVNICISLPNLWKEERDKGEGRAGRAGRRSEATTAHLHLH